MNADLQLGGYERLKTGALRSFVVQTPYPVPNVGHVPPEGILVSLRSAQSQCAAPRGAVAPPDGQAHE